MADKESEGDGWAAVVECLTLRGAGAGVGGGAGMQGGDWVLSGRCAARVEMREAW